LAKQTRYWKERLNGYETLELATDKERPAQQQYEGEDVYFDFDKETSVKIREMAKKEGVSVYTVLLSAYYVLLSAYSGQKDIVVGTMTANRSYEEISGTIGFFVNTLAMRMELNIEDDMNELIKRVGESVRDMQSNQDIPFEMLVNMLGIKPSPDRHPLFQTVFSLQSMNEYPAEESNQIFENYIQNMNELGYGVAKFDLSLTMTDDRETIGGSFNYALSLFERETIDSYIETYKELISQIAGKEE
jgi:non-ribosomal peptide synthetase component F